MLDRGYRDTRPFGTRRADARSYGPVPEVPSRIPDGDAAARPPGPLRWALRTAALSGFVALLATQYLVRASGPGEAPAVRVAQAGRAFDPDPETTGSIGRTAAPRSSGDGSAQAAQATRLDPCALAGSAGLRP